MLCGNRYLNLQRVLVRFLLCELFAPDQQAGDVDICMHPSAAHPIRNVCNKQLYYNQEVVLMSRGGWPRANRAVG